MKKILDDKEMALVSGGNIGRGVDGSYIVYGISDEGEKVCIVCKTRRRSQLDFKSVILLDWNLFRKQHEEKGIMSSEALIDYYENLNI